MKKNVLAAIYIFIITIAFSSCSHGDNEEVLWEGDDFFEYPQEQESLLGFSVDDEGYMYYTEIVYDNQAAESSEQNTIKNVILHKIGIDGISISSNTLDGTTLGKVFTVKENKIFYTTPITYYSPEGNNDVSPLYEYDLDTKTSRELYKFKDYKMIKKLVMINDVIYFLAIDKENISKEYQLVSDDDKYINEGEVIGAYDLSDNTASELPIDFPVNLAATADNNLLVYAHDNERGFYFTEYNVKDAVFLKKTYHDLGKLTELSIYNDKNDFIFSNTSTSIKHVVQASSLSKDSGVSELMPGVGLGGSGIICKGGYAFYYNALSSRIERIKTSAYIRKDSKISMIYTKNFKYDPFNCGYTIDREMIDDESFAISVLSLDKSYDLYLMDSRQDFSENIRDKGAFYPLNKVDGVKEYMEACFPYIQELATTGEGDIWMIPVSLDIPSLIYNEKLCREHSLDLSKQMKYEEFLQKLVEFKGNPELKDLFDISGYIISENEFFQYLRSYDSFDSKLFRDMAGYLKENINYVTDNDKWIIGQAIANDIFNGITDKFMFFTAYEYYPQSFYSQYDFRVSKFPSLTDITNSVGTVSYLCVNPKSKNLKETLSYISELCHYLMDHNQTMLFMDRNLYPDTQYFDDLYDIYSKADIGYTAPSEVYYSDFLKYMSGDIDIETFIKEGDRKLDVYRNE